MTNERLNHLAIINIERSTAKTLSADEIIKKFDEMHRNRRIILH
jgi:hypothetical protein